MSESHTHHLPSSSLVTYQVPNTSSPPTNYLPTKFPTPFPHQQSYQLPVSYLECTLYYVMLSFPVHIVISYHQLSFLSAIVYFSYLLFLSYHCLILLYFCLLATPINIVSHQPCVSLLTHLSRPGVK